MTIHFGTKGDYHVISWHHNAATHMVDIEVRRKRDGQLFALECYGAASSEVRQEVTSEICRGTL